MSFDDGEEQGRSTIWWLVLAVIAAMIWAVVMVVGNIRELAPDLRTGNYAGVAGTLTGHATIIALIVWAALYFLFVRRRAPGRGFAYFVVLFAAVLATEGTVLALGKVAADKDSVQTNIAKDELSNTLAQVTAPGAGTVDMHIKAQGEAGEMERVSKVVVARTLASTRKYRDALAALDYPAFVSPSRLAADTGLVQTRAKLKNARLAVQAYRQDLDDNVIADQNDIRKSAMGEDNKAKYLAGFTKSVSEKRANAERTLDCEDGVLTEFGSIADLLAKPKGRWVVSGNTIKFGNPQDLSDYQAHVSKIRQFASEERALVADTKRSIRDDQDKLSHAH